MTSSITLNQPNPVYGESINFTEVYPKNALSNARGQQYPANPQTDVKCWQTVEVYDQVTTIASQTKNGDGTYTGVSFYLTLGGSSNLSWTGGMATCNAELYYVDVHGVFHNLASLWFNVGA